MKDIYIIRNVINGKVYIGQSKNVDERWKSHVLESKNHIGNMPLHEDMRNFGFDNFNYTVLEQCNDEIADEREQFWIKYFNSLVPNGYNVCIGGIGFGNGINHFKSVFDQETLNSLIEDLMYSGLSDGKLAKKYNCSESTIRNINIGNTYHNPNLTYPLKKYNRKTKEKIKQFKYALKYELDKTIDELAKEYGFGTSYAYDINAGRKFAYSNETYPLRNGFAAISLSLDTVNNIINDLRNSDIAQKDIAAKYNVSKCIVTAINTGRNYFNPELCYPIRENYQRTTISKKKTITFKEIEEIENLLLNTNKSMREIAIEYECGIPSIQNINNGVNLKYKDPNKKYPLREIRNSIH